MPFKIECIREGKVEVEVDTYFKGRSFLWCLFSIVGVCVCVSGTCVLARYDIERAEIGPPIHATARPLNANANEIDTLCNVTIAIVLISKPRDCYFGTKARNPKRICGYMWYMSLKLFTLFLLCSLFLLLYLAERSESETTLTGSNIGKYMLWMGCTGHNVYYF